MMGGLPYSVPVFYNFGEGQNTGDLNLIPGPVSSTLDPVAIPDGSAQDSRNCNVERGIWQLDRRYRRAQLGKGAGLVLGFVQSYAYARLVGLEGNRPYWWPLAPDASALAQLGGQALTHGPLTAADVPAGGGWSSWSYGTRAFFANGVSTPSANESSVYYVELDDAGNPVWSPQWLNYKPDGQFSLQQERPDYGSYNWIAGVDAVVDGPSDDFGKPPTIREDGRIYADNTNYDPTGAQTIRFSLMVTIGQTNADGHVLLDLTMADYLQLEIDGTDRVATSVDYYSLILYAQGVAGGYNTVTKAIEARDDSGVRVWFDISGIPRLSRSKITKVNIVGAIRTDGRAGAYVSGLTIGGSYLNGTTQKPSIKGQPTTTDIEYAAQYWTPTNGGSYSTGMYATLDGTMALGERADTDLPYMGSVTRLNVVKNQSAPFDASGSLVYFYRKAGDRWYLLGSAANTGDPTAAAQFLDYLREPELVARQDATSRLTGVAYSASVSGGIPAINGGAEWKGSNCYFDTQGKLYISRTDDFTDVLWPGIVRASDLQDIGQPRSLQVSGTRDPILCAVAGDSLWLFTRRETYVMAGSRPSTADPPWRMMGVRGAVSKRAAALYETGAIVATDEGLYWLYLDRPLAGVAANQSVEELTREIRGHWAWLLGGSPELTSVTVYMGEIYVTNGRRCLHRTKDGAWLPNEFAHTFTQLWSDPRYGLVGLTSAGDICPFGAYPTDGGTDAAGRTGSPVFWTWTSKRFTELVDVLSVYSLFGFDLDNPAVAFEFASARGSQTVSPGGAPSAAYYAKLKPTPEPIGAPWWEVTVRGSGFDRVQRITLGIQRAAQPRK